MDNTENTVENIVEKVENTEKKTRKQQKTFKERYQDEEYKKKHLEYLNTLITCDCGRQIRRVTMSVHKESKRHKKLLEDKKKKNNGELIELYKNKLELMQEDIRVMKEIIMAYDK